MAKSGVEAKGLPQLVESLSHAADQLDDLSEPVGEAVRVIGQFARPPVRSGRLASSISYQSGPHLGTVTWGVIYAPPIHYGWRARGIRAQPWGVIAAKSAEGTWADLFTQKVDTITEGVKGQ